MKYTVALTPEEWGALVGSAVASLVVVERARGSRPFNELEEATHAALASAVATIHSVMESAAGAPSDNLAPTR